MYRMIPSNSGEVYCCTAVNHCVRKHKARLNINTKFNRSLYCQPEEYTVVVQTEKPPSTCEWNSNFDQRLWAKQKSNTDRIRTAGVHRQYIYLPAYVGEPVQHQLYTREARVTCTTLRTRTPTLPLSLK